MVRSAFVYGLLILALVCGACGSGAPTLPGGAPIAVMVFSDRGTNGMPADKAQQIDQLANWMEPDMLNVLNKAGYAAARIDDPNTPPAPGRYVLRTRIVNYNAGSKAARMFVGYGAGSAKLDTAYELIGPNGQVYVKGAPSIGSGRDWKNAARKINEETTKAITGRLRQGL